MGNVPADRQCDYNPSMNEIVFPAGILQPPYYDPKQDDAYNYGAAGAVIGHEMTHGFDDEGSKYDARGNLVNWWTARRSRGIRQAGGMHPEAVSMNSPSATSTPTASSSPAKASPDLAGLKIASRGTLNRSRGKSGRSSTASRGAAFLLRLLRARGPVRGGRKRSACRRRPIRIRWDRFRANAPLTNMPEFATAFGCKAEDALVRAADKRCLVW